MSRPRVFISHSSKEPAGEEFRKVLAQSLRDAGYRVLVDKDELQPGQDWRPMLNAWMGGCDAAVLLISEAALVSSYVAYEASLLSYRHTEEKERFLLIPVLLSPVTWQKVQESILNPACLDEIQGISITEDVLSDAGRSGAIQRILTLLEAHKAASDLPAERHARRLGGLLNKLERRLEELEEAARALDVDLAPWLPDTAASLKLARSMMAAGLMGAPKAVRVIRSYFDEPELDEMAELLASSWVDCRSVSKLSAAFTTREQFALNGSNPRTARLFVVSACPIRPLDPWPVAQVDGVVSGQTALEELMLRVRNALAYVLDVEPTPEQLRDAIQSSTEIDEPVFVALQMSAAPDKTTLEALRREFPEVIFFLLLGEGPLSTAGKEELKQAGFDLLLPLEQGTERAFWDLYTQRLKIFKGHVRRTVRSERNA